MERRRRLTGWIIALSVLAALMLGAAGYVAWRLYDGKRTPVHTDGRLLQPCDAALRDEQGRRVLLSDKRGTPVMLLFWSSWCEDCRHFLTNGFASVREAAEKRGIQLHLVCREGVRGDTLKAAQEELAALKLECGTLMDPDAALYNALELHGVPSLVLLDAQGRLRYRTEKMPDAAGMAALAAYLLDGPAQQTAQFMTERLMQPDGTIAAAYQVEDGQVRCEDEVLSETQGLLLQYAVAAGDKALFDRIYAGVAAMTENGLTAWRVQQGIASDVDAALDDLRVLDALRRADEAWGGYAEALAERAEAYLSRLVADDLPRDYAALCGEAAAKDVTLCYLDVAALRALKDVDARFDAVADKAAQVLRGGLISSVLPLYFPRYNAEEAHYEGDVLQMNEAMVAVLHAAQAGLAEDETLDWLEKQLREGPLYAMYRLDGSVAPGYEYESTATYALLVQTGLAADRIELTLLALERLEQNRCFEQPMTGSYGAVTDAAHYTFDAAEALLAWQTVTNQMLTEK